MTFFTRTHIQHQVRLVAASLLFAAVLSIGGSFIATHSASALTADTESPTAPGIPTTPTPTRNSAIQWTWSAATDLPSDPTVASGIKGYQYELTQDAAVIINWTDTTDTTATTVGPSDGNYQLHVRALDNAGNPAGPESIGNVFLDQTAPMVTITSPTNGTTVDSTKKITITGSTGDASSYTLSIGSTASGPLVSTSGVIFSSYTWDTTNVPGGNYIATLTAADQAGNTATSEVLITVPQSIPTPPAPTFGVTVTSGTFTTRPIVVTGTVSTNASKITVTILDAKGRVIETGTAAHIAGSTAWSYTVRSALPNATYTVRAHAVVTGSFADATGTMTLSIRCNFFTLLRYLEDLLSWYF
jgi:hypothetical protein